MKQFILDLESDTIFGQLGISEEWWNNWIPGFARAIAGTLNGRAIELAKQQLSHGPVSLGMVIKQTIYNYVDRLDSLSDEQAFGVYMWLQMTAQAFVANRITQLRRLEEFKKNLGMDVIPGDLLPGNSYEDIMKAYN